MKKKRHFIHIHSSTMEPCSIDRADYEIARRTWRCPGCAWPKPGGGAIDVKIQESNPGRTALNFVSGCGLPLARTDFLELFGDDAVDELQIGRVFGPDGEVLDKWVTYRCRRQVIIRGSTNVSYRKCPECNRDVYFAQGKEYLFPEPPPDGKLFGSDLMGLIIPEDYIDPAVIKKWGGVYVERVPVRDAPLDGLPAF